MSCLSFGFSPSLCIVFLPCKWLSLVQHQLQWDCLVWRYEAHTLEIESPTEVRILSSAHVQGAAQVARDLFRYDGVRGLYKGFGTVIVGVIPARVVRARPIACLYRCTDMARLQSCRIHFRLLSKACFISFMAADDLAAFPSSPAQLFS